MKHKERFLTALLLLASSGLAQTIDAQTTNDSPENNFSPQVALARRAYTQPEEINTGGSPSASDADAKTTLAQLPRRMPSPMVRPPMGRAAYPNMWMSQSNGRHALIGAIIGCGLGIAVAAKGNAGVSASLAISSLGAGLGAAMGLAIPSFPDRNMYRRRWPDDDQEARRIKPGSHKNSRKLASTSGGPLRPQNTAQPYPPQSVAAAQNPAPRAVEP
jgi:hypothetical protein